MNWSTAKTWTILALVLLNFFLFALLQTNRRQYELTDEEYKSVVSVLENNNITLETNIQRSYFPMRSLRIKPDAQTDEQKKEMFLGSDARIELSSNDPNDSDDAAFDAAVTYVYGNERLSISDAEIIYTNPDGTGAIELTEDAAARATGDYLKALGSRFDNFKLNRVNIQGGFITVDFREVYQEEIIYNNYFLFTLSEAGIIEISCMYSSIVGFSGQAQKISSPDEALLSFLHNIRSIYVETEELVISSMDIVYYQDINSVGSLSRATPHYRIYLNGRSAPFLFNAFSLQML